jgi:hypothetical protein
MAESEMDSVLPQFGKADHPIPLLAHGTAMAGLAAYDDLRHLMESIGPWIQPHRLESVKLIHEGIEHDPENYGAVTKEAVFRAPVNNSKRNRVYCLALTQGTLEDDGRPSSWSAGVDAAAAATGEQSPVPNVILVSAGNIRNFLKEFYRYPYTAYESPIENPAQAWNAITVGAITRHTVIGEADDESQRSRPVARFEKLSPFSRSSRQWNTRWPIKPDIVMEGGNLSQQQNGDFVERNSL